MSTDVSRFCIDRLAFARRMLEKAAGAANPGADFDPAHGKRFIRVCYAGATADVTEAVNMVGGVTEAG
jgi:aspartate/methionine/tyrosine aminotransferase